MYNSKSVLKSQSTKAVAHKEVFICGEGGITNLRYIPDILMTPYLHIKHDPPLSQRKKDFEMTLTVNPMALLTPTKINAPL